MINKRHISPTLGPAKKGRPVFSVLSFTLVELLVVIAIISILAGMLMPALRGARESSKAGKCVANLKQHAQAVLVYVADHDDYLVPYFQDEPAGAPIAGPPWDVLLCREGYLAGKHATWDPTHWYIRRDLQCPSNHNGYMPNEDGGIPGYLFYDGRPNYAYNTEAGADFDVYRIKKLGEVVNPSKKIMFMEPRAYAPYATPYRSAYTIGMWIGYFDPTDVNYSIEDSIHRGRSNLAFFDGHVESFKKGEITNAWADLTGP